MYVSDYVSLLFTLNPPTGEPTQVNPDRPRALRDPSFTALCSGAPAKERIKTYLGFLLNQKAAKLEKS